MAEKTNVELLADQFRAVPRIEETGPLKGHNGPIASRKALKWRIIHAVMCVLGLLPTLLYLCGVHVSQKLIAVGYGLLVPGGGFIACGGPITILVGLVFTFYLWRKVGMKFLEFRGSILLLIAFWVIGALGGLLARGCWFWGWIVAIITALLFFGSYELRVKKIYEIMDKARAERLPIQDEAVAELDRILAETPSEDGPRELDEEQLKAVRYILEASVRENGDFSKFDNFKRPVLTDNRYQFSVVGMTLMLLQGKYLQNFHGYLAQARRFLINAVTDPRTCAYWKKLNLVGYLRWNPDPIYRANIMLSGWMLPMITSYGEQLGDRRFEEEGALKFRPFEKDLSRSYNYSSRDCVEVLHRQYNNQEHPYMLIPCEPHLEFPTCNSYGLLGMLIYDKDHGTHYCSDFFERLYEIFKHEFVEIEGSIPIRRQDIFGLRHIPESSISYDPMADIQNYLHYAPVFPGLAKRDYALVRKTALEIRDGVTYIKGKKWEEVFDLATMSFNPSLILSQLEMVANEYGDTEIVNGLRNAESIYLERSKDPKILKYKNVPVVVMAYFVFAHLSKKGDWQDIILRKTSDAALHGPILTDCRFPQVMVAKAYSSGNDLDLVLYNGEEAGEEIIRIERLQPNAIYRIEGTERTFSADAEGCANLSIFLDGRTPLHIVKG